MGTTKSYSEFIKQKKIQHTFKGIPSVNLNSNLFKFQSFIVDRALRNGRHCIFADCGLGKTIMQLEWAHQIVKAKNMPVLILCPLAVATQTIREGEKFGIEVDKFEMNAKTRNGIYVTNYEQIEHIDPSLFSGIVLDESSILKNFTGKIKGRIIEMFSDTEFKLACTATPSPNDPMEMGNHAEFMGVMTRNEMLSMFFVHDGGDTAKWRLKKHAVGAFYLWISEWAVMISKPDDIGFHQDGFDLPELNFIEKTIETKNRGNGDLFNDVAVSATNFNQELRHTQKERISLAVEIANSTKEQYIVWVKHNDESTIVANLIDGAYEVKGSDSPDRKEKLLLWFAENEFRVLVTKSKIAQFGLNYQNCHNQIFMSLDFSFESLYQSIRRSYRFGQKESVNIWLITTDTMRNVKKSIEHKNQNFEIMQAKMSEAISRKIIKKEEGIKLQPTNGQIETDEYRLYHGDCVGKTKVIPDNSIHLSVFSPPFAELYVYSNMVEDFGNCKNPNEFFKHFEFLIPELFRVLMPGRMVALHCSDLPIQKGKDGYIGLRDFSGLLIDLFQRSGFIYHSRVTIWKDPVVEMQRTKALGLLHKQIKKDSIMSRVGMPDYVLCFRKEGDNSIPIENTDMPVSIWQQWASPVWMDINQSDTLQFRSAKGENDEKHICPLQLEVIERLIKLYSNEGEIVFSPFSGICSEGYQAVLMNREFVGIELKNEYYEQGKKNIMKAIDKKKQLQLF